MPLKFAKPGSRAAEKKAARRDEQANWRKVVRAVQDREKFLCRCCHLRGEHAHHLRFRSRGGNDTVDNVVLLCQVCHADIHAYRLSIVGNDANGLLKFVRSE